MRKKNCYVYFLYDSEDTLLYIGKSVSLINRLRSHFSKKGLELEPWKNNIDKKKVTIYKCQNPTDLDVYETYFINKYKPKHNTDKVYNSLLSFGLPYLEPIVLLQQKNPLLSLYFKCTKEEQEIFSEGWKRLKDPEYSRFEDQTLEDIDFTYFLMTKEKD